MRYVNRTVLLSLVSGVTFAVSATPASAAAVLGSTACANSNVSTSGTVVACRGWYQGNLNSGNATDLADEATIINSLLGTSYTGATLPFQDVGNLVGSTINFASPITGSVILGVHVGAANGAGGIGYNGTAFFQLLNPGSSVTLNVAGLSNARIFAVSAVPEAGTWAMMLLGLGGIGYALRRAQRGRTAVTYGGFSAT